MPTSARQAIEKEIARRERELDSLRKALAALSGIVGKTKSTGGKRRGRKPMTAAQKKQLSEKMKAAWKRRKAAAKGATKG